MQNFHYLAIDAFGQQQEGTLAARDLDDAARILREERGWTVRDLQAIDDEVAPKKPATSAREQEALAGMLAWVVLRPRRVLLAVVLVLGGAGCVTGLRAAQVAGSPVAALAADRAVVRVEGTVASDPRRTTGPYGDVVVTRVDVREVTGRGATYALSVPVLVLGDTDWSELALGSRIEASGRLGPGDGADLAAVLGARGPPVVTADADAWWDAAAAVRASIPSTPGHAACGPRA